MLFTVVSVPLPMLFVAVPPTVPLKVRLLLLTGITPSTQLAVAFQFPPAVFIVELPGIVPK